MKKNLIILCLMTISSIYAQVGINTRNPQGTLHVDGAKDNPETGIPTAAQQLNDFIVTSVGNVGISTTAPTEKLHVNGKIRITNLPDASSGDQPVYVDANGVLKKITASTANRTIWGVILPNLNGTVTILNAGSGGWTVTRVATGTVMIKVNVPFSSVPAAQAQQYLNYYNNSTNSSTFPQALASDNTGVDGASFNQIQIWSANSNSVRTDRVISFSIAGF